MRVCESLPMSFGMLTAAPVLASIENRVMDSRPLRARRSTIERHIERFKPTASWKARLPPLLKEGGGTVSPYNRDFIRAFVEACETLLSIDSGIVNLTQQENQIIQYYLAALGAKFPTLLS